MVLVFWPNQEAAAGTFVFINMQRTILFRRLGAWELLQRHTRSDFRLLSCNMLFKWVRPKLNNRMQLQVRRNKRKKNCVIHPVLDAKLSSKQISEAGFWIKSTQSLFVCVQRTVNTSTSPSGELENEKYYSQNGDSLCRCQSIKNHHTITHKDHDVLLRRWNFIRRTAMQSNFCLLTKYMWFQLFISKIFRIRITTRRTVHRHHYTCVTFGWNGTTPDAVSVVVMPILCGSLCFFNSKRMAPLHAIAA